MSQPLPKTQDWFDSREALRSGFLAGCGWQQSSLVPMAEDCGPRRYFRLHKGSRTAILMEAVPDNSAYVTPGHKISDFIRIDLYLRAMGLNAPEIYEADEADGYMLLEDFGDLSFKAALGGGGDSALLYGLATDILSDLRRNAFADDIKLPDYYESHVHKGHRRVVDWYMPAVNKHKNSDGLVESYLSVWQDIESSLPPCPQGFLHIDFHVENLMYMPEREEGQQCGLLDFQGAMVGPVPYDMANLLEDVRIDVPQNIRRAMLDRFCCDMSEEEQTTFKAWYRVLATQFHCRVAGQFIRLAVKDGKSRYLEYLPRVSGYLREGLKDPLLAPLAAWFSEQGVGFQDMVLDAKSVLSFVRDDAF